MNTLKHKSAPEPTVWRDRQWWTILAYCVMTVLGLFVWAELGIRLLP